ncbi:replication factor C subunit 2 [Chytriomyces sp. MP71]|nr:replication factor C subunit 2 [Chytriomyces sp. MP71]
MKDSLPWIEKYRPKSMDDISAQEETVQVLRATMNSNNLPHCLFYGPAGTGKTSTILALARDIYGPEAMKSRVLELNASDERGIDIVREKVKNFARVSVSAGTGTNGKSFPPFKIIILDEADSMTVDAQSALRRTMETYSKMTRFCLICNYVSRIIEPLASRCSKFRFKPLHSTSVKAKLSVIADAEGVQCPDETLDMLVTVSEGDLRKAIMYLQSAFRLHQYEPIPATSIVEIAGVVPLPVIEDLFTAWMRREVYAVQKAVQEVTRNGYSGSQLVSQLHDRVLGDVELSTMQKARMCESFGLVDRALVDGSDEQLQLLKLLVSAI